MVSLNIFLLAHLFVWGFFHINFEQMLFKYSIEVKNLTRGDMSTLALICTR
jgi:hypothetical protein